MNMQNRNRAIDTENKQMIAKEKGSGDGGK